MPQRDRVVARPRGSERLNTKDLTVTGPPTGARPIASQTLLLCTSLVRGSGASQLSYRSLNDIASFIHMVWFFRPAPPALLEWWGFGVATVQ